MASRSASIFRFCAHILLVGFALLVGCQSNDRKSEFDSWQVYKGDAASTSYSALDEIQEENVGQLELNWVHTFSDVPAGRSYGKYECNPIVVGQTMYCTSSRSRVYALDAATGDQIWSYDPFDGGRGGGMKRGVTYWEKEGEERILFTASNFLYSLDARDGIPDTDFGQGGRVNLNEDLGVNPDSIWVRPTSPGIIYQDLIILGSEVAETYGAAPGHIRAYDVRTGMMIWIFHTIPHPGEFGYGTWPEDAYRRAGGANNWGGMSLDVKKGIVYAPLGSPSYDFYGADRVGDNLFGNSLVALDAATGQRRWHFQTVHHDVWDYDLPAPPSLVDLDGTPAVSLVTKTGFIFLFDRYTGKSLFAVEERSVPGSDVEGETLSPTQPFPVKPKPFVRQSLDATELSLLPDSLRVTVLNRVAELRSEGLYTPPSQEGTLMVPGTRGGAEWGGTAIDVNEGVLYVNANESPEIMQLQPVQSETFGRTTYQAGQRIYINSCALCHGGDRKGHLPLYPSLTNLEIKYERSQVADLIENGRGRMPAFNHLSDRAMESMLDFLYGLKGKPVGSETPPGPGTKQSYKNVSAYSFFRDADGRPAINPPWGTLHAVDLHTGDYRWSVPLGNVPERQLGSMDTGTENWGGPIVTAGGLVFIAATQDHYIRAFSSRTGTLLWQYKLPGPGYATPATYQVNGRQMLAIAVTGSKETPGGHLMTFALPEN